MATHTARLSEKYLIFRVRHYPMNYFFTNRKIMNEELNIPGAQEAAKEYAWQCFVQHGENFHEDPYKCFIDGAKWMAEQGITVEAIMTPLGLHPAASLKVKLFDAGYKNEDRAIIQVRKA